MDNTRQGIQVPYCTGRNYPKYEIPAGACDCHHHIYDPVRFPYRPEDVRNQPPATVDCYRLLQKKLGTTRNVIVQPSAYAMDNSCTLAALKEMGKENTRAVVVIDNSVTDEELKEMDEMGVIGLRFNLNSGGGPSKLDEIRKLAERVAPLGWSISFFMAADLVVSMEQFLRDLPCEVVIDHRGHLPADQGINHPAFPVLSSLLRDNKIWLKLTGLYIDSAKEGFADTIAVGKALCAVNPDRCIWGTDWPHPIVYDRHDPMPNDASMLDALFEQAGDEETARKILVDNPAKLYRF